jgi:hypothetical protein
MTDKENGSTGSEGTWDLWTSTAYSRSLRCGICGAPVRNVPTMYEKMNIEWRCAKCLRKDKPVLDDHTS